MLLCSASTLSQESKLWWKVYAALNQRLAVSCRSWHLHCHVPEAVRVIVLRLKWGGRVNWRNKPVIVLTLCRLTRQATARILHHLPPPPSPPPLPLLATWWLVTRRLATRLVLGVCFAISWSKEAEQWAEHDIPAGVWRSITQYLRLTETCQLLFLTKLISKIDIIQSRFDTHDGEILCDSMVQGLKIWSLTKKLRKKNGLLANVTGIRLNAGRQLLPCFF